MIWIVKIPPIFSDSSSRVSLFGEVMKPLSSGGFRKVVLHPKQTLKICSFAPCLMHIFRIVSIAKGVISQVSTLGARCPASPAILKDLSGTVHPNKLPLRWIKLIKQGKSKLQTEEELHTSQPFCSTDYVSFL